MIYEQSSRRGTETHDEITSEAGAASHCKSNSHMPRRKPNAVYRTREHLTGAEVERLIDAAKANAGVTATPP